MKNKDPNKPKRTDPVVRTRKNCVTFGISTTRNGKQEEEKGKRKARQPVSSRVSEKRSQ